MPLTSAQLSTLKSAIAANQSVIPANMPGAGSFGGVAVKDVPVGNGDGAFAIAAWYGLTASPDYYVWRTNVPVADIFDQVTWQNYTPVDAPDTTVQWSNRSLAAQGKQFNLQTMLTGRTTFDASKKTQRGGLNDATTNLPTGTSGATLSGGWANIIAILRRQATNIEKLFATSTTGVGNNGGDAVGASTNPAVMVVEGSITYQDVLSAWNS